MGGVQINGGGDSGVEGFFPTGDTQTPPVAGLKPLEPELRGGRRKIVAVVAGKLQKFFGDDGADEMEAEVAFTRVAATIAVVTCERVAATLLQESTQDVNCGSRHINKSFQNKHQIILNFRFTLGVQSRQNKEVP